MRDFVKKLGERLWLGIKRFFAAAWIVILAVAIAIGVAAIWGNFAGYITGFAIVALFIFFIAFRQLWWYITKTGWYTESDDDENKN